MQDRFDDADRGAVGELYGHALEFVVVELVRVVGRLHLRTVDEEQGAAQGVGGIPVRDAGQGHQQPPGMIPGGCDGEIPFPGTARQTATQHRVRGETHLGLVGADVHDDLTTDSV